MKTTFMQQMPRRLLLGAALLLSMPSFAVDHGIPDGISYPRDASSMSTLATIHEQQDVTVSGTVVDQNGEPIPGETVSIPDTGIATATDTDGRYSIAVTRSDVRRVG